MTKKKKYIHSNLGTSPGTLTYIGPDVEFATKITRIEYNADSYKITPIPHFSQINQIILDPNKRHWFNIDGIHEPAVVAAIGEIFHLHPLILEDIMNTQQKPKFEYYDEGQLFFTFKMTEYNPFTREIEVEHLSLILLNNCVISFQEERNKDVFNPVISRIIASAGKTRKNGADYLLYCLIDLVVDHYFEVLDCFSENIEKLEEDIISDAQSKSMRELYSIKREVMLMKKVIFPLREMISGLLREDIDAISANTALYLRDVHDHTSQVLENIESYRELIASLMDLYLSQVSNKMNNIMKVLTVISVIFMPLTFVAGIYGMNFDDMPELHWRYGYPVVWGVMIALVIGMLIGFRKKGWL
jgi:magnesium transporter